MTETQRLRIGNEYGTLPEVMSWIEAFCASHPPASDYEYKLQLVTEEILMNTIKHGYGEEREGASIWLTLHPQPEGAVLIIEDEGPPFDPLKEGPPPDTDAELVDRPIGGLGVMFVREMTDHASYRRDGKYNRLTLIFGPGQLPEDLNGGSGAQRKGGAPIRPRSMTLRVLAILLFLPIAGVITAGALNFLKFERILTQAASERYDPVLRELARAMNDSLGEGLTLASTRTTKNLIDRSVAQFDGAFDLVVYDIDGTELFTTLENGDSRSGADFADPPPPDEIHHDSSGQDHFIGRISILQNGTPVGVLSLSLDATMINEAMPDLIRQLRRAGAIALLPVLPVLALITLVAFGRIEGGMNNQKLAVDRAAQQGSPDPGLSDPLVQAVWRISWPSATQDRPT